MSSDTIRDRTAEGMVYESRGTGRPVVLVHGWCLSGQIWIYLGEQLARNHRVICPDLPGFGRSDDLAGPYDFARHADSISALLEELDLHDAVMLGFAYGAGVVMTAAARDPTRIGA